MITSEVGHELPHKARSLQEDLDSVRSFWIKKALKEQGNNRLQAAKALGLNRNTLSKFISKYQIEVGPLVKVNG
jgi:transcriptional regulator with PAS, ATPase and Fis domain